MSHCKILQEHKYKVEWEKYQTTSDMLIVVNMVGMMIKKCMKAF